MAMGQFYVDDTQVTYAAVDPQTFWRFAVPGTAQTAEVWKRVAGGEIAVQPQLGKVLKTKDGYLKLGNGADAPRPTSAPTPSSSIPAVPVRSTPSSTTSGPSPWAMRPATPR